MSVHWGAMVCADTLTRQLSVLEIRAEVIAQMVGLDDIGAGLASSKATLLDLIPADGAAVQLRSLDCGSGAERRGPGLDGIRHRATRPGDQTHRNRDDPLSPRNSFALWKETLTDQSLPWEATNVGEALALRGDLAAAMHLRSQSDLAHLGMHGGLAGLPNRRMLLEQMDQ